MTAKLALLSALLLSLLGIQPAAKAAETWAEALHRMPLPSATRVLTRTNAVAVMLGAFQSNAVVKALIFMPGATDEFYMFKRAQAQLTNTAPTLLAAVQALTNQTFIRAEFHPPFLLLHTAEDPLNLRIDVRLESAVEKIKRKKFAKLYFDDRDWNYLQPIYSDKLGVNLLPWPHTLQGWHFYRHSFAAWGLDGWEALQAAAYAGKSGFTVQRNTGLDFRRVQVLFEPDPRYLATPKLDAYPR